MSLIQTTDNNRNCNYKISKELDLENLRKIASRCIKDLKSDNNTELLVFPDDLHKYGDEIGESEVFTLEGNTLVTGNIMGFIGINDTQLDIKSRFSDGGNDDYFLHYMRQKVLSINMFDIKHNTTDERIFDFLVYLFPYFLNRALSQGLFKKYRRESRNDANIRGPVDVNRHICLNVPFRGAVAYNARIHNYDNEVTQLVRHTIEYIKTKPLIAQILSRDSDTKLNVSQIVAATPSYCARERGKVVAQNLRPVRHPYYGEYSNLQKICLQILRHETIKFGNEKDKVYGILFDGAWLWEEYLYTFLHRTGFHHAENKKQKGGFKMFKNDSEDDKISKNSRRLYPDFYKDDYILDAKYKRLNGGVGREDLYQVVTYMHCKKASNGGFIYPSESKVEKVSYELAGYGGMVSIFGFNVQHGSSSFAEYVKAMAAEEEDLTKQRLLLR